MPKATIFYLTNCPYCRNAQRAVRELQAEDPACAGLEIEWIEESQQPALADSYDYYRVPSVFLGREKLYECSPADDYDAIKAGLRAAFAQIAGRG